MTGRARWVAVRGAADDAVRTLLPGYFALVMATGIVSIGMRVHGRHALSTALLWLAGFCYAVLVVLTGWRLVGHRAAVRADLADPSRAFGFFTFVAGTDVVAVRLAVAGHHRTALVLLGVGGVSWLLFGYAVPWLAVFGKSRDEVVGGANGTWFIWVVASQSVAVLAAVLAAVTPAGRDGLALLAVACWSVGVFLYAAIGVVVLARLTLRRLRPEDLTQAYWVAMGSVAITVVAGARIRQMAGASAADATRDLVGGASLVFWAFASWLIPALLAAGWWRHVTHRVPLRYDATWWSLVFPLGMYGVAGQTLGAADRLPILTRIGDTEIWIALAAWALTLLAMLRHLYTTVLRTPRTPSVPRRRTG
ncbi:MAG TPA: tellurite resistance/C4-dicarboxylate transporter family protein [Mycobacteriales bacterium]|nr:tellurite resistance/C4-dicarboxylate transporter family protein [Mycobacteriales bacterium]